MNKQEKNGAGDWDFYADTMEHEEKKKNNYTYNSNIIANQGIFGGKAGKLSE